MSEVGLGELPIERLEARERIFGSGKTGLESSKKMRANERSVEGYKEAVDDLHNFLSDWLVESYVGELSGVDQGVSFFNSVPDRVMAIEEVLGSVGKEFDYELFRLRVEGAILDKDLRKEFTRSWFSFSGENAVDRMLSENEIGFKLEQADLESFGFDMRQLDRSGVDSLRFVPTGEPEEYYDSNNNRVERWRVNLLAVQTKLRKQLDESYVMDLNSTEGMNKAIQNKMELSRKPARVIEKDIGRQIDDVTSMSGRTIEYMGEDGIKREFVIEGSRYLQVEVARVSVDFSTAKLKGDVSGDLGQAIMEML